MRTKTEIISFLEGLVHSRFTEEQLNEILSAFFDIDIKVYNASQERLNAGDDDGLGDWNLMFTSLADGVEDEDYNPVDGDIYILPMRRDGMMYITEVGYEFI